MNLTPFLVAGTAFFLLKAFMGSTASTGLPTPKKLYVLGDSQIANGVFSKKLRSRTSTEIINGGTGGYGIRQLRKEWLPDLLSHQPDMVLLWAGVNDIASKRGAKHVKEQIELLRDEVRPAPLVVFEIPPWGGYHKYGPELKFDETNRSNALLHTIEGITVIPTGTLGTNGILDPENTYIRRATGLPEGLHFGSKGYDKIVDIATAHIPLLPLPKGMGILR